MSDLSDKVYGKILQALQASRMCDLDDQTMLSVFADEVAVDLPNSSKQTHSHAEGAWFVAGS